MALLNAITKRPEGGDRDLIQQMNIAHVPAGSAYHRLMDAAEAIKTRNCCSKEQLVALSSWLARLPNLETTASSRITKFSAP